MGTDTRNRRNRPLAERLDALPTRVAGAQDRIAFVRSAASITLTRPEEIAAAALGALVLRRIAAVGQTRAFPSAVETVTERLTAPLQPDEVMNLEVEAYELLDWLLGPDDDGVAVAAPAAVRTTDAVLYDPNAAPVELLQQAIDEGFDVWIDYFSKKRGEMNTRRVAPLRIDAETWLRAFCHSRRQERHFRISRITRCVPVGGRAARANELQPAPDEMPAASPVQQSLLHE
jgi:predicted DNA-binding transcriptional regulator YafY